MLAKRCRQPAEFEQAVRPRNVDSTSPATLKLSAFAGAKAAPDACVWMNELLRCRKIQAWKSGRFPYGEKRLGKLGRPLLQNQPGSYAPISTGFCFRRFLLRH